MSVEYREIIENLRRNGVEFGHLATQIYLDHAANGIYMTSLIREYALKLAPEANSSTWSLLSNPHSHSQSGIYTNMCVELTREKILNMFNTTHNEYDIVYVSNVSEGLKLLAENFNFQLDDTENEDDDGSSFVYLNDNHTSVLGMREIVSAKNVYCAYESSDNKLFDIKLVRSVGLASITGERHRNLFVYPAQSNFNGRKYEFDLVEVIKKDTAIGRGKLFFAHTSYMGICCILGGLKKFY